MKDNVDNKTQTQTEQKLKMYIKRNPSHAVDCLQGKKKKKLFCFIKIKFFFSSVLFFISIFLFFFFQD